MKKLGIFLLTILVTPLFAGLYGILHDQLTYTICPEYYTKFKFIQFGLLGREDEGLLLSPRLSVAIVGFLASWWTGIIIGVWQAVVGLIHKDHKTMLKNIIKATLLTIAISFLTGIVGLAYGKFYLSHTEINRWFPDNLIDKENFITVGSMHNFSYLGGLIGLVVGVVYQLYQKRKQKKDN